MSARLLNIGIALLVLEISFLGAHRWLPDLRRVLGIPQSFGWFGTDGPLLALAMLGLCVLAQYIVRTTPSLLRPVHTRSAYALVLPFLGLLLFVAFVGRLLDPSFDAAYTATYALTEWRSVLYFLATLPFFLLAEELLLRFLQRTISLVAPVAVVLITTSLHFAILHYTGIFPGHEVSLFLGVLAGGLVLNTYFQRTQNLWSTLLLHVVYDTVIILQIFVHVYLPPSVEILLWGAAGLVVLLTGKVAVREWRASWGAMPLVRLRDWFVIAVLGILLPILLVTVR